jgi:ribosomal protein S18 acetylase RimI-like enzyme
MTIRELKQQDFPEVAKLGKDLLLLHAGYDPSYYELEENFDELYTHWLNGNLNSLYQFILVAEENGKVVGFISGFIKSLYSWFKTKSVGHVGYLAVDINHRRQGIGKMLEKEATNWFKNKNVSYVEVYVDETNEIGKHAWEKYHFLPFKRFLRKRI